jgi:hypothetical protein
MEQACNEARDYNLKQIRSGQSIIVPGHTLSAGAFPYSPTQ